MLVPITRYFSSQNRYTDVQFFLTNNRSHRRFGLPILLKLRCGLFSKERKIRGKRGTLEQEHRRRMDLEKVYKNCNNCNITIHCKYQNLSLDTHNKITSTPCSLHSFGIFYCGEQKGNNLLFFLLHNQVQCQNLRNKNYHLRRIFHGNRSDNLIYLNRHGQGENNIFPQHFSSRTELNQPVHRNGYPISTSLHQNQNKHLW